MNAVFSELVKRFIEEAIVSKANPYCDFLFELASHSLTDVGHEGTELASSVKHRQEKVDRIYTQIVCAYNTMISDEQGYCGDTRAMIMERRLYQLAVVYFNHFGEYPTDFDGIPEIIPSPSSNTIVRQRVP